MQNAGAFNVTRDDDSESNNVLANETTSKTFTNSDETKENAI